MVTISFGSTLVGTKLPGSGCAYMGQEINFLKPVHLDDTVTAKLMIKKWMIKNSVFLWAEAFVSGELVANGETKV